MFWYALLSMYLCLCYTSVQSGVLFEKLPREIITTHFIDTLVYHDIQTLQPVFDSAPYIQQTISQEQIDAQNAITNVILKIINNPESFTRREFMHQQYS